MNCPYRVVLGSDTGWVSRAGPPGVANSPRFKGPIGAIYRNDRPKSDAQPLEPRRKVRRRISSRLGPSVVGVCVFGIFL